jgi:hypothetical protein
VNPMRGKSYLVSAKPFISFMILLAFFCIPSHDLHQPTSFSVPVDDQLAPLDPSENSTFESPPCAFMGVLSVVKTELSPFYYNLYGAVGSFRSQIQTLSPMGPRAPPANFV